MFTFPATIGPRSKESIQRGYPSTRTPSQLHPLGQRGAGSTQPDAGPGTKGDTTGYFFIFRMNATRSLISASLSSGEYAFITVFPPSLAPSLVILVMCS